MQRIARMAAAMLAAVGAGTLMRDSASARSGERRAQLTWVDPADDVSPLDLRRVTFGQRGDSFLLALRTYSPWRPAQLSPTSGGSLCILITRNGRSSREARVCVRHDGGRRSRMRLRLITLDAAGRRVRARDLGAAVERVDDTGLRVVIGADELRLTPGSYRWQAYSHWTDSQSCSVPATCDDLVPDSGQIAARYEAPKRPIGCEFRRPRQVARAPGSPNTVALTFDDGPSAYTPRVLRILKREGVHATFFLVGHAVQSRPAVVRQMLREGHMVANHSLTHANLGAGGPRAAYELRRTQRIIRLATGFTPCLFRPPYGSTSPALVRQAGAQRLTTVMWDVDPRDWSLPGTGTIERRIESQARRGSIVLMHDGGGPRGQTLAALPRIIHAFKRRHYHFVTVNQMLGLAPILH